MPLAPQKTSCEHRQIQPFTLRDYQKQVIYDTYNLIRLGEKRILLFAPTGAGKTLLASKITRDAVSRGKRVLFVVHRDILVAQTAKKFKAFGLRCGFIKAGWAEDANAPVQIASVQTLACREKRGEKKLRGLKTRSFICETQPSDD
ncbi:MAG: DEAD/DEAH box helicase family protein [Xenococcaceae cyanobacterium MO_167.B27]|nr:DEAD/DEAH box helicase family protein [Xenococcaceae cyanobacterium MO_167.B27]